MKRQEKESQTVDKDIPNDITKAASTKHDKIDTYNKKTVDNEEEKTAQEGVTEVQMEMVQVEVKTDSSRDTETHEKHVSDDLENNISDTKGNEDPVTCEAGNTNNEGQTHDDEEEDDTTHGDEWTQIVNAGKDETLEIREEEETLTMENKQTKEMKQTIEEQDQA